MNVNVIESDGNDKEFLGFEIVAVSDAQVNNQKENETSSPIDGPKIVGKRCRSRKQRLTAITNDHVSNTFDETMSSNNHENFYEAMRTEISSLEKNGIWSLVDLPVIAKAIETKWVFALKKEILNATRLASWQRVVLLHCVLLSLICSTTTNRK